MSEQKSRLSVYLILVITALSLIPLRSLKFEFDIESLFPKGDDELAFFQEFRGQFRSDIDDEFIFIGLRNSKGIFDSTFLAKADSLTRYVSKLDHVTRIYSLTRTNLIFFDGERIEARPLIHISQPAQYPADSVTCSSQKNTATCWSQKTGVP